MQPSTTSAPKCAGPVTHEALGEQTTARAAAGAQLFCLDLDEALASGGTRPDRLTEVRPQEWVQRHTVDQNIDTFAAAPLLNVPVPLMEEQMLLDVFSPHDREVPELVIEVPKIICEDIPTRSSVPEPQLAEQLVEVPTHPGCALAVVAVQILGWRAAAALSRSLTVPVPARGGGGERGGLQGLRPDHPRAGYKYWPPRRWQTLRFYGPLYLAVTCSFWFLPEEYSYSIFWEMLSGYVVFSASCFDCGRRFYCRGAEADSYGLDCLSDQKSFSCCWTKRSSSLLCRSCSFPGVVQTCRKLWRFPQLQFLVTVNMPVLVRLFARQRRELWRSRSCSSSKVVDFPFVRKTTEIPQLQYVACWSMPLLCMSCLTCPSLCNDRLGMAQIAQETVWKHRRCFAVVDVAVISQRQSRPCREVPQARSSTGCSSAEEG